MHRYFFHLHSPGQCLRDNEGATLPDLRAAVEEAVKAARFFMRVPKGDQPKPWRGWSIEASDEQGNPIFLLPFDSVEAVTAPSRPGSTLASPALPQSATRSA